MDLLSKNDLQTLLEKQDGYCLSIFMPTFRAGKKTQQNSIRFKNLLAEAKRRLLDKGLRPLDVEAFLQPAYNYLHDCMVWRNQSDGLAFFISFHTSRYFRLPLSFEELVMIGNHFYIKPLLPLFIGNENFYILCLNLHNIRLLKCSHFHLTEVNLRGIPKGIEDALSYDNIQKQLQFHTGTPGPTGKRAAMFHGQGVGIDDTKQNILRFFRQVDGVLHDILKGEKAPIILAGLDYHLPIYKEANSYPHLLDEGISGNPEEKSDYELHTAAWEIVRPLFLKTQKEAILHYNDILKNNRVSNDLRAIVPAALNGRIKLLFIANNNHQWGRFNPQSQEVDLHEEKGTADEDLLDLAAVQTLLHGGAVYIEDLENIPGRTLAAAVFHY